MGCFSQKCNICGEPVNSDSFSGEYVYLFLLKNGKVIEQMQGQYDSYGRVFDDDMNSIEWKMDWGEVCTLWFNDNEGDGLAYIHGDCYSGTPPTTISERDPNQGWGRYKHPTTAPNPEPTAPPKEPTPSYTITDKERDTIAGIAKKHSFTNLLYCIAEIADTQNDIWHNNATNEGCDKQVETWAEMSRHIGATIETITEENLDEPMMF